MKLLEPYKTDRLDLKNRVIMSPMTRNRSDNSNHLATDMMAEYYRQRATAGLIISEGINISPTSIGYAFVPGIWTSPQTTSWKKVTSAVHQEGGLIYAQLWHCGRISHPDLLNGSLPLGPSAINANFWSYTQNGFKDTVTPKAMTIEDINEAIEEFAVAASNAIEAGFDGIELHGANGYLFHQFFAKCANQREDNYGGTVENRARFLFEVLDAIQKKIPGIKIGIKLAPAFRGMFGIELDDDQTTLYEYVIHKLNDYNLAYVHIGGYGEAQDLQPIEVVLDNARRYRKFYHGTYIINRGFTRDTANQAILDGVADLVSFGELFIANPDLVRRFRESANLNVPDTQTFYGGNEIGYLDYPTLK